MSHIPRESEPEPPFRPAWLVLPRAERDARLCRLAKEIAGAAFDVSESEMLRPSRSFALVCVARHIAMYLASTSFEVRLASIAREFGRDRTSVGHAIRRIEDRRDDRRFDEKLDRLERLAAACLALGALEGTRQ